MTQSWLVALLMACSDPVAPMTPAPPAAAVAPEPEPEPLPAAPVAPPPVVPAVAQIAPASAADVPVPSPEIRAPGDGGPALAPVPAASKAADYTLQARSHSLYVVVTYLRGTLGSALAHDHVVAATKYTGTVHWDPADPSACRVAVDVPTSGLRVDPPGARARAGLEGDAPVEDQPKIEENFNSKRQLDSSAFPVLTFRSETCAARPDGRVDVTGPLVVHGVSRPTTVTLAITADGTAFSARGKLVASHGDFGMSPFTAAMGAVKNAEPLAFTLDLVGKATD